jgi:hypothetical protein
MSANVCSKSNQIQTAVPSHAALPLLNICIALKSAAWPRRPRRSHVLDLARPSISTMDRDGVTRHCASHCGDSLGSLSLRMCTLFTATAVLSLIGSVRVDGALLLSEDFSCTSIGCNSTHGITNYTAWRVRQLTPLACTASNLSS